MAIHRNTFQGSQCSRHGSKVPRGYHRQSSHERYAGQIAAGIKGQSEEAPARVKSWRASVACSRYGKGYGTGVFEKLRSLSMQQPHALLARATLRSLRRRSERANSLARSTSRSTVVLSASSLAIVLAVGWRAALSDLSFPSSDALSIGARTEETLDGLTIIASPREETATGSGGATDRLSKASSKLSSARFESSTSCCSGRLCCINFVRHNP
jgi:hypothetical protein